MNVDRRQEIRNQVTQLANTQNPIFDIRNNLVYILADILAYILADALSININHKCSIVEIMKAEEYLEIYQILVISGNDDYDFVYVGPNRDKRIVLFHHDDHYDYIKSLPAFFNKDKFCFVCLHPYQNDYFHSCVKICKVCKQKNCVQKPDKSFKCEKCKILCSDKDCFLKHQEEVCKDYS